MNDLEQLLQQLDTLLAAMPKKQRAFVLAYHESGRIAEAVRKAGYKTKAPGTEGWRLRQKSEVSEALDLFDRIRQLEHCEAINDSIERLTAIIRADIRDYRIDAKGQVKIRQGVGKFAADAIESVDIKRNELGQVIGHKIKLHNSLKAIELLWKRLGLLKPETSSSSANTAPIGRPVGEMTAEELLRELDAHDSRKPFADPVA